MKVIFGGVRGTSPTADAGFLAYGGHTTAVLIEGAGGEKVFIDAGTGVLNLAARLARPGVAPGELLLLFTHYHLDHVMGFPAFHPFYQRHWDVTVAAPLRKEVSTEDVARQLIAPPFWPLDLGQLRARVRFEVLHDHPRPPLRRGGLEIRWCAAHHPGGCHAYRIDEPATGAAFVFATDMEWGQATAGEKKSFLNLCTKPAPAGLLVVDGQFNAGDIEKHRGWGHSTWEEGVTLARETGCKRLLVTHHAPENNDATLAKVEAGVRAALPSAALARDGMEVDLPAPEAKA